MVRRRTGATPAVCDRWPGCGGGGGYRDGRDSDGFDGDDGDGDGQPVVVGDGRGDGGVEAPICPVLSIGGFSEVEPSQAKT